MSLLLLLRSAAGGTTAPTYPASQNLAEGTGTRALTAVTTTAGDWLVVEIIVEINSNGESFPPTCTGLTFTLQNDAGTGGAVGTDVRVLQYTAPDATGASRTVTITPAGGSAATHNYRALLTVDRGSTGPGAKGTTLTAQTVTFTRTGSNSGVHMAFGDFSTTGAAAGASFQPGAAAAVSVTDGTGADYYFGRWNDSGAAGSSAHGVNVGTNTLATPAGAALEMLGTTSGPATLNGDAALAGAGTLTAQVTLRGSVTATGAGTLSAAASVLVPGAASLIGAGTVTAAGTAAAAAPFVVGTPTSVAGTGATTTALAWDAGTVAGDLLEMWVAQVGQQLISSTSLGLTQQQRQVNSPTNNAGLTVLGKVLTSGDITAGTVTATFAASQPYVVTLVTVRNHNGLDAVGTGGSGTGTTTVSVPAETPTASDTLILGGVGGRVATAATDVTWTWPGPLVELTEVNSTGAGNRTYLTLAQQTEVGSPVASGPDAPVPSSTIAYSAFRISIVPAGSAGTTNGVAAPTAAGTLTADATVIVPGAAALAGAGTVTAGVTQAASSTLTGTGTLTAQVTQRTTATPAGAGTLTASGTVTILGTASLAGAGTLTAQATQRTTAALSGAGTLTATPTVTVPGTAAVSGAGTLTASAGGTQSGTAALTGSGTLTAGVTQRTGAALTGAGSLSAQATQQASAAFTGAGALTAGVTQPAAAAIAGAGTLSAQVTQPGAATITGTGTVTAISGGFTNAAAVLTAAGTLTAAATVIVSGTAALTGAGSVTAQVTLRATATATGAGTTTATATVVVTATATLTGAGAATAAGATGRTGTASLLGAGTLAATATFTLATLTGAGTLTATPTVIFVAVIPGQGATFVLTGATGGSTYPIGTGGGTAWLSSSATRSQPGTKSGTRALVP